MKKTLALILSLCLITAMLAGCGKKSSDEAADDTLAGTWVYGDFDTGYIFNTDLTGTDTFFDLTFTYTAEDGTLTITYDSELYGSVSYTYEVTDTTLTMTRISDDDSEEPDSYTYTREGSAASVSDSSDETESTVSTDLHEE